MDQNIIKLFQKYLNRQCETEELDQVINIIERGKNEAEWEFVLSNDLQQQLNKNVEAEISEIEVENVHRRIQNTIDSQPGKIVSLSNHPKLWPRIAVAASIVFVLGFGGYLYFKQPQKTAQTQLAENDVAPGKNTATLTLANGRKIVLSSALKGQLAKEAGVTITKATDGKIVYQVQENNNEPNKINTLTTARGETYRVDLPDGTKVWLNAASSLKYPASFASATERKVILTGEAYFEVAKDKLHPFKVETDKQEVTVLGTHFNINSYDDEPFVKTTLLEGRVKVLSNNSEEIIIPGQQSILKNGNIIIQTADIEEAVAWKNNEFLFNEDDFLTAMRKVSRWYDVDIIYDKTAPKNFKLGGFVSRTKNISAVLKLIQLTGKVHFKVEGRRILVTR